MSQSLIYLIPFFGVLGLLFVLLKSFWIIKQDSGTDAMNKIGMAIETGALAFLKAQYRVLLIFVILVGALLAWSAYGQENTHYLIAISFIVGALCSAISGYIGMRIATKANVRTTNAARLSLGKALQVAFAGGSVMGIGVVSLGILGLGLLLLIYIGLGWEPLKVINVITGFSFGASSIALFARVGGGIYTKAADVGADLVGKVEAGIPEDHPLNPATIADNVGDNVGDIAGMGADLFESFVGAIVGTMVLGAAFVGLSGFENTNEFNGLNAVLLPLILGGVGILTSVAGTFFVRVKEGGDPQKALNTGEFLSSFVMLVATYLITKFMLPEQWTDSSGIAYSSLGVFWAVIFGLGGGLLIGIITEFYTGSDSKPVKALAKQSITGSATNIIAGLGLGMQSTALPIIVLSIAILGAHHFAGLYGIAIAAVGMLSNTGIQLAVDAYGPISDNAGGIAEMSELPKEVRHRTDKLDAVGNTTAAIGKGFAIGSAALTALALFAAYMQTAHISSIDVSKPMVTVGLFLGSMLPYLFSSLSMNAVGKAAMDMIKEVRRQFTEIPALKAALEVIRRNGETEYSEWSPDDQKVFDDAHGKAEYSKCVEISTKASIREMILPGIIAVVSPIIIGFFGGKEMLGGLLAGVTASGVLMAIFQSNAGGAWDNAKKLFEEGFEIDGKKYFKGSEPHKAGVVGDTVGDPFKDTSGPSLNILLKLISVIALVIAPFL
ncbi:MAG: sodium-translocating pyrophosphatase [Spirosomataceae bacterium]|jgi:K(+)-stimulated pyrophosphate-energized sodium pump